METMHETSRQAGRGPTRRQWMSPWAILIALAVLALAIYAVVQVTSASDLEVAQKFADTWEEEWVGGDGEALAALFTEDGVYVDFNGTVEGREAIARYVDAHSRFTESSSGVVTETSDGEFVFQTDAVLMGLDNSGDVHLFLEGDLVSRVELVDFGPVE